MIVAEAVFVAVAVNVTGVPEQISVPGFAASETAGVSCDKTFTVIEFDETVFETKQPLPLTVMVQVITSPLARPVVVYTFELPDCTLILFTLKSYTTVAVPVPAAVAVKFTAVPRQILVPGVAVNVTLATADELTTMGALKLVLLQPQPPHACTVMLPDTTVPKSTVIVLVPCPLVMVAPAGTVH